MLQSLSSGRYFSGRFVLAGLLAFGAVVATAGCETLDERDAAESAAPVSGWASEFRASDKETRPLGFSSRARDIERSVGIQ